MIFFRYMRTAAIELEGNIAAHDKEQVRRIKPELAALVDYQQRRPDDVAVEVLLEPSLCFGGSELNHEVGSLMKRVLMRAIVGR